MTGPYDSVIGVRKELVIDKFVGGMPARFEAATGDVPPVRSGGRMRQQDRPGLRAWNA